VASALVTSRLDYVNSILYGMSLKNVTRLQRVQNALVRVVAYQRTNVSTFSTLIAPLKQLHWLPIEWCIQFKLATLTFKTIHTNRPPYLTASFSIISAQSVCIIRFSSAGNTTA